MDLWTYEQYEDARSLIWEQHIKNHGAGWNSLDQEDIDNNVGLLQQAVREKTYCEKCPGLEVCSQEAHGTRKNWTVRSPNHFVITKMWFAVTEAGRIIVHAAWGKCRLAKGTT